MSTNDINYLSTSKLYPNVGTNTSLVRERLDPKANFQEDSFRICSIVAPAGYGKSTLMARWNAIFITQGIATAWLNLDNEDNDPARFLRHLIAAFKKLEPLLGEDALAQLSSNIPGSSKLILESLSADFDQLTGQAALFIDDLQFATNPEALDIIEWLINYSPPNIQYILGSREEPKVRLASLRVRHQLCEIGYRDLQFSYEETNIVLKRRLGRPLEDHNVRLLLNKTEGWPAGLELAILAMTNEKDIEKFIEQFSGSDRSVVDYLAEVLLAGIDRSTKEYIQKTSLFECFCDAMIADITGIQTHEIKLETLRSGNLFLIPLDDKGTWFRFHHLVADFIRDKYIKESFDEAQATLTKGAQWFYENGEVELGINYSIKSGAWALATKWLSKHIEDLSHKYGQHQTIMYWIAALPEHWIDRHPIIRIQYAYSLSFFPKQNKFRAQMRLINETRKKMMQTAACDKQAVAEVECAYEFQQTLSLGLSDKGHECQIAALEWLKKWPDAPLIRKGTIGNLLAFGEKTNGKLQQSLKTLRYFRNMLEESEGYYGLAWNYSIEAIVHMKLGDYDNARLSSLTGIEKVNKHLQGHRAHASTFHVILAAILYDQGQLHQSQEQLELGKFGINEYGTADILILCYITQARIHRANNEHIAALHTLNEGRQLGRARNLDRLVIALSAEECQWACFNLDFKTAKSIAIEYGFQNIASPKTKSNVITDKSWRIAPLMQANTQSASLLDEIFLTLSTAVRHQEQSQQLRKLTGLLIIRATIAFEHNRIDEAKADMIEALKIATKHNYIRAFIDPGNRVQSILSTLSLTSFSAPEHKTFFQSVAKQLSPSNRVPDANHRSSPMELTKRELEILRRLESGLTNKEIAESIFISENTLKWHLSKVYSKLGTKNRTGAITTARSQNLI